MGIVINQSIKNTIITYIGFAIGAANTLFMYPHFLGAKFYGLTGYLLSFANVIFPLMQNWKAEEAISKFCAIATITDYHPYFYYTVSILWSNSRFPIERESNSL